MSSSSNCLEDTRTQNIARNNEFLKALGFSTQPNDGKETIGIKISSSLPLFLSHWNDEVDKLSEALKQKYLFRSSEIDEIGGFLNEVINHFY